MKGIKGLFLTAAALTAVSGAAAKRGAIRERIALKRKSGDDCDKDVRLDLLLAVDNTGSMTPYLENLASDYSDALKDLEEYFPGSRFGLATFNDITVNCTAGGHPNTKNYCNRLEVPLGNDLKKITKILKDQARNHPYGDYFTPEDSLGVMAQQSNSPFVGWREPAGEGENWLLKKVMVVVTDDIYRFAGDAKLGCRLPDNDGDWDYKCGQENYFTEKQAAKLIKGSGVMPVVTTLAKGLRSTYVKFFEQFSIQGYVTELLGENTGGHGSHDPADDLTQLIMDTIDDIACHEPPPTQPPTEKPTTMTTTTTTTPTTTTTTPTTTTTTTPTTTTTTPTTTTTTTPTTTTTTPTTTTTTPTTTTTTPTTTSTTATATTPTTTIASSTTTEPSDEPTTPTTSPSEPPPTDSDTTTDMPPPIVVPPTSSGGKTAGVAIGAAVGGVAAIAAAVGGTMAYRRASAPVASQFSMDVDSAETGRPEVERDLRADADLSLYH